MPNLKQFAQRQMQALRRLTYRPELIGVARVLHVSGPLKWIYWRLTAPSGGIYSACIRDTEAKFYARTPGEWRKMEGTYTGGREVFLPVLVSRLRRGDVFYDIGANIGEYTVFAAKAVGGEGSVFAFEPEQSNYRRIEAHLELNGLRNARAFNVALGEKCGEMFLEVAGFLNSQCRLVERAPAASAQTERVKVMTGDGIRRTEQLPVPNAVKIDVEGYEYYVLKGLRNTLADPVCRLVCCEVHPSRLPAGIQPAQVAGFIQSLGFSHIERFERGTEVHLICTKPGASREPT
jgi:FkbM family methyltransferase